MSEMGVSMPGCFRVPTPFGTTGFSRPGTPCVLASEKATIRLRTPRLYVGEP